MENNNIKIPKEKFSFVNEGDRLSDKKFDDKPIGYLKDAWIRFRKSRASVVAAIIIICIVLFAFLAPVFITNHDSRLMCNVYARKPGRIAALRDYGIFTGATEQKNNQNGYIKLLAIGVAAQGQDGSVVSLGEAMDSPYQPVMELVGVNDQTLGGRTNTYYTAKVDTYLQVGFIYRTVEQEEYRRIQEWQEKTGIPVLFPLIDTNSEYCIDPEDPNCWYKARGKGEPIRINENGEAKKMKYSDNMKLEENYKRDPDGNLVYGQYSGGGDFDTAQMKIRVLYYNYYQYLYDSLPDYIMGTDSQGYDLALRIAGGIKLSLMIAIAVSVINFVLGAMYGAVEGYYGGATDIIMERISDILSGVPFIVVATLFQLHLAKKVGPIPSLLFAYVVTGWIGTASRVRSQFYRFKNQEYVMAARTLGARDRRIIWKHIFPNTLGTLITSSALVIPGTILNESMLSYLGIVKLGGASGTSLGTLLSDASGIWTNYPHLMLYPALVISLMMICFNLFGNGLRDAFNPALRGVEE